jgi:hypothetical protein
MRGMLNTGVYNISVYQGTFCFMAQAPDACYFYFIGEFSQLKFSLCAFGVMKFKNNCCRKLMLLTYKSHF